MIALVEPASAAPEAARTVLKRHGRTFHFASHALGRVEADRAARLYAFCRMLDDTADAQADACGTLLQIEEMIHGTRQAVSPSVSDFLRLVEETAMPVEPALGLIAGLRSDQGLVALQTVDELLHYSYQVAGTVGLMMCAVLNCRDGNAHPFAIDLGIAMQLTNIARDVGEDARLGRRYLPQSWTGPALPEEILAASTEVTPLTSRLMAARDSAVTLAESYYVSAFAGLAFLPSRARVAILIAACVYRQIGQQAKRNGRLSLARREVVNGPRKLGVALNALAMWLPRPDFHFPSHMHDASLHAPIRHCFGANKALR